jgi:hypothetical protein
MASCFDPVLLFFTSLYPAGVFVGLRYNAPDLGGSSYGGSDSRRRSGKWASLTLAAASPMEGARIVDMRSKCHVHVHGTPM